jgi:penicillin-binding protein 1A
MSHSARNRRRRQEGGHFGRNVLIGVFTLLLLAGGAAAGAVAWVMHAADQAPPLTSLKPKRPGSVSSIYAADGTRLAFIQANDLHQQVTSKQIPGVLKQATVAIEDQRFYKHKGVDYEGLARAAVKNATSKKTVQGGSTLTMQLVRNLYTEDYTRTGIDGVKRKLREAKLADELEKIHDKDWVLTTYINTVPYGTVGGQTAIGAGAAARIYFNKRVQDLTLREAAMLAGMPQAPSEYSPVANPDGTRRRRNEVLNKMAELKMISPQTAAAEEAKGLGLHMGKYFHKARERYFVDYVTSELDKEYGAATVKQGGLKVYTTIDLKKQQEARAAIKSQLADAGPSSAIVSIDPSNGDIVAMASSADYGQSKFNLAAQGHRQPGSVFKVFTLMTALNEGVNPDTTHYTSVSPIQLKDPPCGSPQSPWDVKTYGGKGAGDLTLHAALLKSDNSVFAQLASDLGPDKVEDTARAMGITSPLHGYCAETLGGLSQGVSPLEVADAYATIADGGYRNRPRAIRKVVFPDGHSELPKRWKVKRTKVFDDGVTYEATKILEDNVKAGTGTRANFGCPAGGKTGTTDHNTDAWFSGFTPKLATAVWVGYPSGGVYMNTQFNGGPVDGGTFPAAIWHAYMQKAVGKYCGEFPKPKVPFQSQPFMGHYATTGKLKDPNGTDSSGDQTGTDQNGTGKQDTGTGKNDKTTGTGGADQGQNDGTGGNGGTTYDPGQYETKPQGPPKTQGPTQQKPPGQ